MPKRVHPLPDIPVIGTLEEADATLAAIAAQKRQINLIELSAAERIEQIKLGAASECEDVRQKIVLWEQALLRFADYHKPDLFTKKKSVALTFGVIGYRASAKLKTASKWTWERVLAALKTANMNQFIRVKEEVDKEALRALAPEKLAEIGVKIVPEDVFYYELDEHIATPGTGEAA